MSDQGKSDPHKDGADQYKRHIDGSVRVSGQIEVHPSPDSIKEDKADREHQRTHRNRNFVVSLLTLISVIIYAAIAAWQGCLTGKLVESGQQQTTAAQQQLQISRYQQRAFLWITQDPPPHLKDIKDFQFPIKIQNVGHFSASKVEGIFTARILSPDEADFTLGDKHAHVRAPLFPPGAQPQGLPIPVVDKQGIQQELTPALRGELMRGEKYIVVFGSLTYEDPFGSWWIQFCNWGEYAEAPQLSTTQATAGCMQFNSEGGTEKR